MRRRLFNLAAAVSLLLFVVVAAWYVRSYYVRDWINHTDQRGQADGAWITTHHGVMSDRGRLQFLRQRTYEPPTPPTTLPSGDALYTALPEASSEWSWQREAPRRTRAVWNHWYERLGFSAGHLPVGGMGSMTVIVTYALMPHWFPLLLTAGLPAWWLWRWRRRRRIKEGCCRTCGYDLRATPEAGGALLDRCPECGTAAGVAA